MQSLEATINELKARESIRECIHLYALAGDRANDAEILKHLFTADARYEAVGMGRFEGRDAIVNGLAEIARSVVLWGFHVAGGPLIQFSNTGDCAKVYWWVWCPVRTRNEDDTSTPCWGAIHYNGELVEEGGAWKFRDVLLEVRMRTPFEGPWTEIPEPLNWPQWAINMRAIKAE